MIFSTWQLQFKYCNTAQYLKRISLLVFFFKVQTMSDLVSDSVRDKKLRIIFELAALQKNIAAGKILTTLKLPCRLKCHITF